MTVCRGLPTATVVGTAGSEDSRKPRWYCSSSACPGPGGTDRVGRSDDARQAGDLCERSQVDADDASLVRDPPDRALGVLHRRTTRANRAQVRNHDQRTRALSQAADERERETVKRATTERDMRTRRNETKSIRAIRTQRTDRQHATESEARAIVQSREASVRSRQRQACESS